MATGDRLTYRGLAGATGLAVNTVRNMANNTNQRADQEVVNTILSFFAQYIERPLKTHDLWAWEKEADTIELVQQQLLEDLPNIIARNDAANSWVSIEEMERLMAERGINVD